jgi:tRNA modification GTPase
VEYGHTVDAAGHRTDTGLAWVLVAPHSYTGEDMAEITCHNSPAVLESLLEAAIRRGAALAGPGEFTRRALLNGRIDLLQAEAVLEVIRAENRYALTTAYGQASGRLSQRVRHLKELILRALTLLEAELDFSEDIQDRAGDHEIRRHVARARQLCHDLSGTFEAYRQFKAGTSIALIGRPNVGKSSLMNALLAEDRAIVTPEPGTTRDLVEASVIWSGRTIHLVDTAGIQETHGAAEQEGVRRAQSAADSADFLMVVVDGSTAWQDGDSECAERLAGKAGIVVVNKVDLATRLDVPLRYWHAPKAEVSALTGQGLRELQESVASALPGGADEGMLGITRQRHWDLLERAGRCLERAEERGARVPEECMAADLQEALLLVGELLGEDVSDEVLDRIFSEYCVGK